MTDRVVLAEIVVLDRELDERQLGTIHLEAKVLVPDRIQTIVLDRFRFLLLIIDRHTVYANYHYLFSTNNKIY